MRPLKRRKLVDFSLDGADKSVIVYVDHLLFRNKMTQTQKAIVTKINYAGLAFDGLMLPDGSYAIAFKQVDTLFNLGLQKNITRGVKALFPKGTQDFKKTLTEMSTNQMWILTLDQFSACCAILCTKNEFAMNFVLASTTEKLERIFDSAFGVVIEEREREQRFAARLMTKASFRPLTDQLQLAGFTESWEYGKFIKAFQDHLSIETGTRDDLDLQELLYLGNCQSELKCLMKAGYSPWDALELWISTNS